MLRISSTVLAGFRPPVGASATPGSACCWSPTTPRHALDVGDMFVVLRRGRVVARLDRAEAELARLVELMSG